jgi:hypothetical protein
MRANLPSEAVKPAICRSDGNAPLCVGRAAQQCTDGHSDDRGAIELSMLALSLPFNVTLIEFGNPFLDLRVTIRAGIDSHDSSCDALR